MLLHGHYVLLTMYVCTCKAGQEAAWGALAPLHYVMVPMRGADSSSNIFRRVVQLAQSEGVGKNLTRPGYRPGITYHGPRAWSSRLYSMSDPAVST